MYKRFDLKKGRILPPNAIPCQEADNKSGHHPHWVKCNREDKSNKWHFIAFDELKNKQDGTYELCGIKVQGNPEKIEGHQLIKHGSEILEDIADFSFDTLKNYLTNKDIEGIVFYSTFIQLFLLFFGSLGINLIESFLPVMKLMDPF